ncbi:MAG: aspartate kinase [Myxococcota bacterium]
MSTDDPGTNPPIIVQKYGGTSVATPEKLEQIAEYVVARHKQGLRQVVVVSAMGTATDDLLSLAKRVAHAPDRRELDMLLTVGERITMALLAMAIRSRGVEAVSLTGSQSGILTSASHTNAKVMEVRPFRIQDELERGRIVIVAGYQGVSYQREVTTLGRGGSDTTAVALAAALDARACEIYSDVDGVWTSDPRVVPTARRIDVLDFETMQAMSEAGAKVLHSEAVEFAREKNIAIYARQTGSAESGTVVRRHVPSTRSEVCAVGGRRHMVLASTRTAEAFGWRPQIEAGLRVEQWDFDAESGRTRAIFDASFANDGWSECLTGWTWRTTGVVSVVGRQRPQLSGALESCLAAVQRFNIRVHGVWYAHQSVHILVDADAVEDAQRLIHDALGLGGDSRDDTT